MPAVSFSNAWPSAANRFFGKIAADFVELVENRVSLNPRFALLVTSFLTSIALRVRMVAPQNEKNVFQTHMSNSDASKIS
jgi:hypothetical protein